MMCRGFLLGGTAGRSTLNGEGLQHQDGHSQVVANTIPNLKSYDPAFAYELVVIIRDGIRRMYTDDEKVFYYITLYNENYAMPAFPADDVSEAIVRGMYRFRAAGGDRDAPRKVHVLASGSIMQQALASVELLEDYGCAVDIWSVTSFNELYRDAIECDRWNRLHPAEPARISHLARLLADEQGVFVGVSDYMKAYAESIAQWMPGPFVALGTDGFGLSESREQLRDHFEIAPTHIALAALDALRTTGAASIEDVQDLIDQHGIDAEKINPANA
jgi:pyruvate dehydrogenase E1 component